MDLKALYQGLDAEKRRKFCKLAGCSQHYMRTHVVYARKMPRRELLQGLHKACRKYGRPKLTYDELIGFFLKHRPAKKAA